MPFWKVIFRALIIPFLVLSVSCHDREKPRKVSLYKRSTFSKDDHPSVDTEKIIRFGFDLRLGPKDDVKIYSSFLHYLEVNTGYKFTIRFTEGYEDTAKNLGKGITDLAAIGSVNYIIAKNKYNVDCLVMGLNNDRRPEYRAVIFTKPNSSIKYLKDLRGKSFAFGNKYSTQGHIIPRKMLEDAGLSLADLKDYAFTGSHKNTVLAVINGKYDAGGIQDNLANRLVKEGKIKIIAISKPYPSSLIAYNKGLSSSTLKKIKNVLLSFDPKGRDAPFLIDWEKTEMPGGFTECSEERLREVESLVIRYKLLR
jgi:phosphonate transport system substrate-binding protein